MIKRFFSALVMLCIINIASLPIMAQNTSHDVNKIIDAQYKTELNLNKAAKGQVVQFISAQEYKTDNLTIPKGTIFNGEIKHFKKGRWGYRRAKAVVKINEMILPDGKKYKIKALTKPHVLKGSALANTGKGIVSFPVAIAAGALGAVIIIVEAVSIVGLVLIGPTSYLFGEIMGKLTHGINYKKYQGDEIQLKLKNISNSSLY